MLLKLRHISIFNLQIVISNSGRMLFVGTRQGMIRSLKFPLAMPIEYVEYQAHTSAVTSLVLSQDDQFLVSSSADSTVIVWRVTDKGPDLFPWVYSVYGVYLCK